MFYGTTLILHELTPRPFEPQSPILVANLASRMFRVTRMRYIFAFFRKRELNFQLKATGPTVTKFFMVMTGYMHWMGCLWYLLSELVIRFDVTDDDPATEVRSPKIFCHDSPRSPSPACADALAG